MEVNNTVKTLLQYSQLNIKVPLKNLSTLLRKQLKDGFCHEDIPQYCDHIITIKELIVHYHGQPDIAELHEDILELLENVCLPLLHHIHPTIDNRKEVFQLLGCVGQLISTCTKIDNKLVKLVIESIDENLTVYIKEKPMFTDIGQHEHVCYDIHTMLEILRQVLIQGSKQKSFELDDTLKSDVASLFDKLIIVVELVTIEVVGSLCIPVMLKILQINKSQLDYFMRLIWQCILSTSKSDVADVRKQYMLLCGFANQFFPLDGTPNSLDLRTEDQLWLIVQAGLVSKDTINRKRSLYILKRVVDICETVGSELNVDKSQKYPMFWWSQDQGQKLSKVWESFMLLAEVFEDKQIHVIKPLLPRMKTLMTAAELSDSQGPPLLHTSWLMTLFYRCSFHESLQIIRWASDYVLSLDLQKVPLFEQQQDQYLTGPLLDTLKESKLYVRDPSCPVGSMPLIADKLSQFYTNCCQSLPQHRRGEFLCQTIQHVCETNWSFVPLFFVVRSLALVPASPCLDQATVNKLRKLLSGSLVTAESYLRGAIQCFLVQMVTNLTDKSKVELEDTLQLFSLLCREDSLQRGTTLWNQTVAWLKEASEGSLPSWTAELIKDSIEKKTAKYLETAIDAKLSNADTTSAGVIARLLLLASDASMVTTADETGSSLLVRVFQMIGSVINAINTHAYMPKHKADKALLLLNHIVAEANPQKCASDVTVVKAVRGTIGVVQPELLLYLCRQTSQGIETMMDLPLLDLYLESLNTALIAMETVNLVEVGKFVDACCRVLLTEAREEIPLDAKLSRFAAMCMLGELAKFLSHDSSHGQSHDALDRKYTCLIEKLLDFLKSWKIQVHFPRPAGDSSVSQKEWGKVTSCYLQSQWQLVRLVLQSSPTSWAGERYLLDLAMETLAVGLEETVYPVIQSIGLLINKMLELGPSDDSYIVTVIEACWAPVIEARRAALFFNVLEAFVQTAFQQCLLCRAEESKVVECLRKYGSKIVQMGLERNGVANTLVEQLWLSWKHPAMVEHVHKYMNLLVQLCMFGDLPKRTDRLLFDVCAAIRGLGSACSVNDLRESLLNKDVEVRATAINILCLLDPAVAGHQVLATRLIAACVEEYTDILQSHPHITFSNSLYHRQRHRLMQVVLLLEQFTSDAYLGEMWKFVWSALEQESQPSIRHMLEWIAVANITRHETLLQDLWNLFAKFKETKNLVLLSLLTIVVHVGPHLNSSLQEGFLTKAIPAVLPWCMAHHFNTRIFAQAALVKLWDQCQNLGLSTISQKHAVLQTIVDFHEGNRNSTKNVTKLLDSFFFKYLDTKRDFSIETLFYTLPKMTGLTEEEWMGPDLFLRSCHTWESCSPTTFIPLRNSYHQTCETDIWRYRGGLKLADEEDGEEGGNGDVQKKIMPWRQMMVEDENQQEIDFGVKQGTRDGLVVVTSLIDKIPNLGGLCRTSEIFGVSEYVLGKLQYVEDKAFQSLSVTAHKWLPITEVYETKLPEYLQQKRLEGYTLVGVEQTANSVSLTDYVFPEKTLLLLGNEKEGIPVDLISLLDVCVEIPQQGVVRSLNVHVSGALFIWEYRRQQLVKDRAQKMSE